MRREGRHSKRGTRPARRRKAGAPLTSNEKISQTLARMQSPSYYIPGDGSTEGTGSEPDKPFDQKIRGQTFNDMNLESYTNTQASDEDLLIFN